MYEDLITGIVAITGFMFAIFWTVYIILGAIIEEYFG